MNLQEILDYRKRCLFCDRKLEIKSLDLADVHITRTNKGLLVEVGSKDKDYSVYFKFDGTYERMKKWNSMYVSPLSILRECPKCIPKFDLVEGNVTIPGNPFGTKPILLKSRSAGMTTMTNTLLAATTLGSLKDKRCAYTFDLFGYPDGNFDCNLNWEDLRSHDKARFYQVKTNFLRDETKYTSGHFRKDTLDTMQRLDLPAVNLSRVYNKEELLNKINLYNTFS